MSSPSPEEHLRELRKRAKLGGGKDKQKAQHSKGKLTAWQRIELLFDAGSFVELQALVEHECWDFDLHKKRIPGDGVITGWGTIGGRVVYAYAQDFTVLGGSLSATNARKIVNIMKLAVQNGVPIIGLSDSGGARIHEGVGSLGGYADIFYQNVRASGVVPQLSVILGPCAGGAVYSPAITDFIFMVEGTSHMFITGPDVIKAVTSEQVTFDDLGGAQTHCQISGVADLSFVDEQEAFEGIRKWLSYMPSNNLDGAPRWESPEESEDPEVKRRLAAARERVGSIVPADPQLSYNMAEVVEAVVDPGSFWALKPDYAPHLITGFARLGGEVVGVVANNPDHIAGVLDIDASVKGARFVRFCDAFHIPLITFVDVPGFLPGIDQEKGGIIRHGAKLLFAYSEATVPKLTVITRKAYGGAYDVMSSKHIGGDLNLAWPRAEIAVMGAEGACNIIFRRQLAAAQDPVQEKKKIVDAYAQRFSTPYQAAQKGFIDAVIFPEETRSSFLRGLEVCRSKRRHGPQRKHGNIPL